MKAIRVREFGGPEVMKYERVDELNAGPGQLLINVMAVGVNPVDTYIRSGKYGYRPGLPYTPGADAAGIVESLGSGVSRFKLGDRVYTSGTLSGAYASQALVDESHAHPLPEGVSFEQGAAVGVPYGTAYRALFQKARAEPGETVLVHGASGGVGTAAVQLARAAGLLVIGTAGTEDGRRLVAEVGARHVLDHKDVNHFRQAREITGNRGVDVVVEMLANVNLGKDLQVLAPGGRVVVVGSRGTVELDPRVLMSLDASVLGMVMPNVPSKELASIHAALYAGLSNGTLKPVVGRKFPLAEAAKAHYAVMEEGAFGKVVLIP